MAFEDEALFFDLPGENTKMKTLILFICMLFATTAFASRDKTLRGVHIRTAHGHIVYIRIDKSMIGADIEIYSATGDKLLSKKFLKRRALIDFYFEKPGTYTIKIHKDNEEAKFDFTKEDSSPELTETSELSLLTDGL